VVAMGVVLLELDTVLYLVVYDVLSFDPLPMGVLD
jgi:hypothetical protein